MGGWRGSGREPRRRRRWAIDQVPPARQELALRVVDAVSAGHELESLGSTRVP